jgi:AAA domain
MTAKRTAAEFDRAVYAVTRASEAYMAGPASNDNSLFKFEMTDDIGDFQEKEWLVEDWLGVREMSQWIGDPGCGKSTIIGDVAVHIAAGRDWFGKKVVQWPVIYFAAERRELTRRRIKGLQNFHGLPKGQPFAIVNGPLDIRKPASVDSFIEAIRGFEGQIGAPPVLCVIDTFSIVFSASGGNEKEDSDMAKAYANLTRMRTECGIHVALVHHVGVSQDAKQRGRGSSVQTGVLDTTVVVAKGPGGGSATTNKVNDGEEGLQVFWGIEPFTVATNAETGKVTSVPIPIPKAAGNPGVGFTPKPGKLLAPGQAAVFSSLRAAIEADGIIPPDGAPGFPADALTVSMEQWRSAFYQADIAKEPDAPDSTRRSRFHRGLSGLEKLRRVSINGNRVWSAA